MNRPTKRLFFAVRLPSELQERIAEFHSRFKVNWVRPKNLHLTLKFLGSTPVDDIASVLKAVNLNSIPGFTLKLEGVGAFPQILWIGISEGSPSLIRIAAELDRILEPLGFTKEARAFVPHLTIARMKDGQNTAPLQQALLKFRSESYLVREVVLFESQTLSTGAVYYEVASFSLGTT